MRDVYAESEGGISEKVGSMYRIFIEEHEEIWNAQVDVAEFEETIS